MRYIPGILKLIEVAQSAIMHALTIQEMYDQNLGPADYDRIHDKQKRRMSEKFESLRASVNDPEAFARTVAGLETIYPKTRTG